MQEIILRIIKIGLPLSVIASMFGLGLRVLWSDVAPFRERPLLMLRSVASVILLVPLAALCIITVAETRPRRSVLRENAGPTKHYRSIGHWVRLISQA